MIPQIEHSEQNGVHTFSLPWGEKILTIQTGKFAKQANSECTVRYGDTVVFATAVMGKEPREGIDYFPLLVDFEEKFYAAGKIKGSRFIKREGRPSDEAILSGRIVDRSIRPFFDDSLRIDVQVVVHTLSWDGENDPDTLAVISAAAALHTSDIPWDGPIACVRMNYVRGQWVLNATYEEREESDLDILVSVRDNNIVMVEAEGNEASEQLVVEGFEKAVEYVKPVFELIQFMREKVGKEKQEAHTLLSEDEIRRREWLKEKVEKSVSSKLSTLFEAPDKSTRNKALDRLQRELNSELKEDADITKNERNFAISCLDKLLKKAIKELYLRKNQRIDGRAFDEIRPLQAEVGLLPRTHGSGLFSRGETQALTVLTLGAPSDEQILDTMEETDTKKRFMHHYNFPGFSVGEVKPNRGAGRREIGHGALAEKALMRMIPDKASFPYTIRVVSETLSSNGSSSMAATCGLTLALMDAGVPIKQPVVGVAMGIMTIDERPSENYKILTDIQGAEDHYGEMDFKVAGTKQGITAIQLDVKNKGLTPKVAQETIEQAKLARLQILEVIKQAIPNVRPDLSPYAPRIYTLRIKSETIGDVIGPKGKVINKIIEETGVAIDIEEDGLVMITSIEEESAQKAIKWIKDITREVVVGEVFTGKVTRIMDFGAFVEILPGKEGLVHISALAPFHVDKVTDVVNIGDEISVKVIEIDQEGRTNLSLKDTDFEYPPGLAERAQQRPLRSSGQGFRNTRNEGRRSNSNSNNQRFSNSRRNTRRDSRT